MALSTANAAVGDLLQGSAGAGYQYTVKTSQDLTSAQSLSDDISGNTYWTNFAASHWTNDIAPHVSALSGTTYTAFTNKYGSTGIKDYIDAALVSPDFKT